MVVFYSQKRLSGSYRLAASRFQKPETLTYADLDIDGRKVSTLRSVSCADFSEGLGRFLYQQVRLGSALHFPSNYRPVYF